MILEIAFVRNFLNFANENYTKKKKRISKDYF